MKMLRSIEWIAFAASAAVILYAGSAAFDYVLEHPGLEICLRARETNAAGESHVLAEAMAHLCAFIGLPDETRLGLHLSLESGDTVLVYYKPRSKRDAPVLRWIDDKDLSIDLGELTWLTPQITEVGHVKISYGYSGAEPSVE